ncbi:LacI family DNA-binding transcriptional regulator [Pelagicoccus mobilis]|uniref:LacI family DNA-binding transcriptional regulator n=1 Tax=Pelagicoccus mobilis TaxID=415221 RepID=A0A934RVP9_9BACT|nr:LacI family DNA-binding transcriptional regulator [Pelagicoccus mobilis]MBK1877682.1 LacI family DNA-binding transcriptional regulator [Pelagicoccus mobilis]
MQKSQNSKLQPVTMKEIGIEAGVSQSTVSRALRNDSRITEPVRERVQAAAKKLNYRPNPLVSAFTSQVRGYRRSPTHATIGFLSPFGNPSANHIDDYYKGAADRARELGFETDLIILPELEHSWSAVNRIIRARSIQGLLVLPVPQGYSIEELDLSRVASATVDPSLQKPDLHRATPDYFHSMELALNTLTEMGYKRISFCSWDEEQERIGSRWLGSYFRWQQKHKIHLPPYISSDDWDEEPFVEYINREKPDVIVSNSRFYYKILLKHQIPVPDRIAFASLCAMQGNSAMGGIDQCGRLIASAAIDLIVSQMYRNEGGIPEHPKSVSIRGQWVDGETTPRKKP